MVLAQTLSMLLTVINALYFARLGLGLGLGLLGLA